MRQGVPGGADAPDQGAADGGAGVARQVEQERLDDWASELKNHIFNILPSLHHKD